MPIRPATTTCLLALTTLTTATAHAELITELTFDALPSAQGWNLTQSGPHANDTEAQMFNVDGTGLNQTTVGLGMGFSSPGNATYTYLTPTEFDDADVISIFFTTAVSQHEQTRQDFSFGAHRFYIIHDGQAALTGIKPNELSAARSYFTPAGFDGTLANSYQLSLDTTTNTFEFFLNGNLVRTGSTEASSSANGFYLMDGTGTANANARITQFVGVTGTEIPEPATTAAFLGLSALALRRRH
ncbi:MAG: hypothetical protein AAGJ38_02635 [Planctomycetota bacterium]